MSQTLSYDDYFKKQHEFRFWLKKAKNKYIDELSSKKSRSYFRHFVDLWNAGKLEEDLYDEAKTRKIPSTSNTSYRWAFAAKHTRQDEEALRVTRAEIDNLTNDTSSPPAVVHETMGNHIIGPHRPLHKSVGILTEESQKHMDKQSRKRKRDLTRAEELEDLAGPREKGRDGVIEKKKIRRETNREYGETDPSAIMDINDDLLMGTGEGFDAMRAERDAARQRFEKRKEAARQDTSSERQQRRDALMKKEAATMAMFSQMARERFG